LCILKRPGTRSTPIGQNPCWTVQSTSADARALLIAQSVSRSARWSYRIDGLVCVLSKAIQPVYAMTDIEACYALIGLEKEKS
jgi:hypothetical protein